MPGYIKPQSGFAVFFRDICVEGWDDCIWIVGTEMKQVSAHQACGTDDQHPSSAGIAVHFISPAAAPS
jgi:hypothetical protein